MKQISIVRTGSENYAIRRDLSDAGKRIDARAVDRSRHSRWNDAPPKFFAAIWSPEAEGRESRKCRLGTGFQSLREIRNSVTLADKIEAYRILGAAAVIRPARDAS